jgi:hypothetical protein
VVESETEPNRAIYGISDLIIVFACTQSFTKNVICLPRF